MPRSKIKDDDLDFDIFVDPSCLDEPAEDSELLADNNTKIDTTAHHPDMATEQLPDSVLPDSESVKESATVTVQDIDVPQEQKVDDVIVDKEETTPAVPAEESDVVVEEQQKETPAEPTEEIPQDSVVPEEADAAPTLDEQDEPTTEAEPEPKEGEEQAEAAATELDNDTQEEPAATADVSIVEPELAAEQQEPEEEQETKESVDDVTEEPRTDEQDVSLQEEESHLVEDEANQVAQQDDPVEEAAVSEPQNQEDTTEDVAPAISSQPLTDRKTSLRTEALIQAAARAVVAKLERRQAGGDSIHPENDDGDDEPEEDLEHSILSTATEEGDTLLQYDHEDTPASRRQSTNSTGSQLHHEIPSRPGSCDEGGESSSSHSHHEPESDDVFSDRSARSSIASFDNTPPPLPEEADDQDLTIKSPATTQLYNPDQSDRHSLRSSNTRSPRVSGISMISDLSQYDKEDFIPTSRESRAPFRTLSDVRNIQMSSPTPSVIHGVTSPRSSRRQNNTLPTISRLGSPNVTGTQFSPKGRSTPTRLKARREAPLVLLHVTVLPLRWMWGDILNCLDALNGKAYGDDKQVFQASEQLKSLRDSWRELQDHVSDTVLERGVLMPHPQDDFEVLEERFLESLELPLRRRARILECGHYLGPANDFGPDEEFEEEEEYASQTEEREEKRHWCNTCRNEIKYEDLGPGKVFRVKVYASNGLMRAGAWEACWKEMERVDVEVEPIVELSVQNELEKLVVINSELEEQRQREIELAEAEAEAAAAKAAQEEEARLGAVAQSRPQSVAGNAMVIQEAVAFGEEQALPPSRSLMDTPVQERSSAMISSPAPSAMQMMNMHASPAQPPSTVAAMRFTSPSPQPAQSSPLRHAILPPEDPVHPEEASFQQDMYADATPQPLLPIEPPAVDSTSSMYTHHPTMAISSRNPDQYHIPPSPRSPSEEAYERRHRRGSSSRGRSTHSHHSQKTGSEYTSRAGPSLENASFIELFLEAFKVLLRDPKNVAIIVLCLFVMAILGRPSTSPPQNGLQVVQTRGDGNGQLQSQGYGYEPKVVEAEVVGGQVVVPPPVQVETVVTTEASVLVVTTTVTSAPAEPSVEVEIPAVDSVVAAVDAVKSEPTVEVAVMVEEAAQDTIAGDTAVEEVEELVVEDAENVEELVDALSTAAANATASLLEEEEQAKAEGMNQTEASIPVLAQVKDELAFLNTTDATELPQPAEEEEAASTIAPAEEPVPIVSQEEVLVGPQNMETSATSASEHTTETGAATTSTSAAQADATTGTESKDPCPSIISQKTTLRVIETVTETVTVSVATASATSSEAKVTAEAESSSKSASESEPVSTVEVKSATTTSTSREEIEISSASVSSSTSASTSVSESASTMTETTTAPPSPKTVQETVYETETETVRVTVSVGGSGSAQGQKHDEL